MKYLPVVKQVTSVIVTVGTGKIVSTIINSHVAPQTVTDKVTITAGGIALGALVADVTAQYTNAKIDEVAAAIQKIVKK